MKLKTPYGDEFGETHTGFSYEEMVAVQKENAQLRAENAEMREAMEQIARATFLGGWVEANSVAVAVLAKYPKDGEK
jgi:hypothetical protein